MAKELLRSMQLQKSEQFCHDILASIAGFSKSTIQLLQSLSSSVQAGSVIELSESPLYAHHHSSISQSISQLSVDSESHESVNAGLTRLFMSNYPVQSVYVLQTDTTPLKKPFSQKLEQRQYIQIPNNVIAGNKSLSIGYNYSYVNLSYKPPESQGGSRWSLPLSVKRVTAQSNSIATALEQTQQLMTDPELPFGKAGLVVQNADSGYCSPRYIAPLIELYDNIAVNVRFRHGSKVWFSASKTDNSEPSKKGAKAIYGDIPYYLQSQSGLRQTTNGKTKVVSEKMCLSIYDVPASEILTFEDTTSRGRLLKIEIRIWCDTLIRTKKGHNMKDKPFDLLGVQVFDAQTGELVFQKPLFVALFGKRKAQVLPKQQYDYYRNRFDIEGHNRHSKQRLLLDKYQTPDVQNLDNWTLLVATAYWLCFVAADEVQLNAKPWEKYLPSFKAQQTEHAKENPPKLSVSQVQKATQRLFLTFEQKAFAPKSVKNGKGRRSGYKLTKRRNAKVTKKSDFDNETRKNE